jgi:hypothetical protein
MMRLAESIESILMIAQHEKLVTSKVFLELQIGLKKRSNG